MKKTIILASIIASVGLVGSAQATQYVTNGNFASLSNGLGQLGANANHSTTATDWATTGYNFVMNVGDVGSNGYYGNLPLWDKANGGSSPWNGKSITGDNFVALDGDFGTEPLTQTINGLTVGKAYILSFSYAYAQQARYNGPTHQNLQVSFGNNSFTTSPTPYTLAEHGFSGWETSGGTFIASGTSQVLSFLAQSDTPVPPFALLTDVSVTSVPEPATWGMMIVGLAVVGAAVRRRRQVLATA